MKFSGGSPGNQNGEAEIARMVRHGMTVEEAQSYLHGLHRWEHERAAWDRLNDGGERLPPWTTTKEAHQKIREARIPALRERIMERRTREANPERHMIIAEAVADASLHNVFRGWAAELDDDLLFAPKLATSGGMEIMQPQPVQVTDNRPAERLLRRTEPQESRGYRNRAEQIRAVMTPERRAQTEATRAPSRDDSGHSLDRW